MRLQFKETGGDQFVFKKTSHFQLTKREGCCRKAWFVHGCTYRVFLLKLTSSFLLSKFLRGSRRSCTRRARANGFYN